jgi:hypothetical protein
MVLNQGMVPDSDESYKATVTYSRFGRCLVNLWITWKTDEVIHSNLVAAATVTYSRRPTKTADQATVTWSHKPIYNSYI